MRLKFKVNEYTLIPREDTEILVQKGIEIAHHFGQTFSKGEVHEKKVKILDMCTGSGCIAISLAKYFSECIVEAVDISNEALQVARDNALMNEVNVHFIQSNLFEKVTQKYDMIISNPPYISSPLIPKLQAEVQKEPHIALDGGEDGLNFYHIIAQDALVYLETNGVLLFEIGFDQGQAVSKILKDNGYEKIELIKDLSQNDRVVLGYKR